MGFADVWNANNRLKEARQKAARPLSAQGEPEIEVSFRRSVRVAPPIAIKDTRPERSGFSRDQIAADQKRARKY